MKPHIVLALSGIIGGFLGKLCIFYFITKDVLLPLSWLSMPIHVIIIPFAVASFTVAIYIIFYRSFPEKKAIEIKPINREELDVLLSATAVSYLISDFYAYFLPLGDIVSVIFTLLLSVFLFFVYLKVYEKSLFR